MIPDSLKVCHATPGAAWTAPAPALPMKEAQLCADGEASAGAPVVLMGVTYNTNNYGVRVLLSGTVGALAARNGHLPLAALEYQHHPEVWQEETASGPKPVELINLRFSWKVLLSNNVFTLLLLTALTRLIPSQGLRRAVLGWNPTLRRLIQARMCLSMSGGDSFSDIYGLVRLLYVAAPQLLALWANVPLVQLPQTFGPFKSRTSRWISKYILSRSTAIYSRDYDGQRLVSALLGVPEETVKVSPDFGFFMAPKPIDAATRQQLASWRTGKVVVGLNTSKLLYLGGYTGENMFGLREDYVALTHALVTALLAEPNVFVLFIPHVFGEAGETELPVCRELLAKFHPTHPGRVGFIDRTFDHREIKGLIGECDAFLGARMHACIAAVSQAVPTVALAYSDKFKGVMDVVASPGVKVVDLRDSGVADIMSALTGILAAQGNLQSDLRQRMPALKERIATTAERIVAEAPSRI